MKIAIILTVTIALLGTAAPPQNAGFNRVQLSPKGQVAYDRLFSACVFRVGGVGYAGQTSEEELALYDLLEEKRAGEALKSLVSAGSYEGGLYGLVGLSLTNHEEFNRAVDVYKARKEARGSQPTNLLPCNLSDSEEYVATQSGCIYSTSLRTEVVTEIQSGRYDSQLRRQFPPR